MKKTLLSILLIFSVLGLKAQSELSVQVNGGSSHYSGPAAQSSTFLNVGVLGTHAGYANNEGNGAAPSYGISVVWQYVFKFNLILGAQGGYEMVGSKANITAVEDGGATPATGYTTDHNSTINLNPYFGYRLHIDKVKLDIMPGFDIAIGIHNNETVNVKASDGTYYNKVLNPENIQSDGDLRLRLGLAAYYKKFGINASYAHGIYGHNLDFLGDGPIPAYYGNIIRLGISYRIK